MSEFYIMSNELYHHGILGQKWGVRRYQNPDGSLTAAGKKRYASEVSKNAYDSDKLRKTKAYKTAYDEISKRSYLEDYNDLKNTGKESVSKFLGKYGDKEIPLSKGSSWKETINEKVAGRAARDFINEHQKYIDNYHRERLSSIKDEIRKQNIFSPDTGEKVDPKRADKIAEFGLKALNYSERDIRRDWSDPLYDPKNKSNKDWFLYEDQTIGLPSLADMAMRGYSKDQIKDVISKSKDVYWNDPDEDHPGVCFDLSEGYKIEKYVDDFVDYYEKYEKK